MKGAVNAYSKSLSVKREREEVRKKRTLVLKILTVLVLSMLVILTLSGCRKTVREETINTKVQIDHVSSTPGHYQRISVGDSSVSQWVPATYSTTVKYNLENLEVSGYETHLKCKDLVGEFVFAEIVITYYSDGSCSYKVVSIQ